MANQFVANPVVLRQEGQKLVEESVEFTRNVSLLYSTVHELVNSAYVSSAARAIAADIEKYHVDLDNMAKTIRQYGNYCTSAAGTVMRNEQNIIDNIK